MDRSIADLRENYSSGTLTENAADADPMKQFRKWWDEAKNSKLPEPNAMTLATSSADGQPAARIVLLKDITAEGFVFFTNYSSNKAMQLEENPKVCLVFLWKELERQVRITGLVSKIDKAESDEYFHSRPRGSQLSAIVSPQSRVIENREWLENQYKEVSDKMEGTDPERPGYWGGYCVRPSVIEFWQGRPSRLHDRLQYTLLEDGNWQIERLAP